MAVHFSYALHVGTACCFQVLCLQLDALAHIRFQSGRSDLQAFTAGNGMICLAAGGLLQLVFVLVPAMILSSINAKLFILDVESARQLLPRLRLVSWGKPYNFVVARVDAFADYIQDKRHEGDRLMLEWQKPGMPRPVIEQAQATVFNGRLLLWDWQGTIELFEEMRKQPNVPKSFWLWVSRAYSELGYLDVAVSCIVEADLAQFGATQQMLAAALLPFLLWPDP